MYCKNTQALTRQSAGKSTFSRALKYAYDNEGVRMMNCKGAMNTCEICNNASALLRNKGNEITAFILCLHLLMLCLQLFF